MEFRGEVCVGDIYLRIIFGLRIIEIIVRGRLRARRVELEIEDLRRWNIERLVDGDELLRRLRIYGFRSRKKIGRMLCYSR